MSSLRQDELEVICAFACTGNVFNESKMLFLALNENNLVNFYEKRILLSWPFCRIFNSDIDECDDGIDNCHIFAHCSNEIGSFSCSCNDGYTGDGLTCSGMSDWQCNYFVVYSKISTAKNLPLELLTHIYENEKSSVTVKFTIST